MATVAISGKQCVVHSADIGEAVTSGDLDAGAWYIVDAKGGSSNLPLIEGAVFRTNSAIALVTGDVVRKIALTKMCVGNFSTSASKGTIEVTDSCSGGNTQYISDGFMDLSGSIDAFLKFDSTSRSMGAETKALLGRFFDVATDDGSGTYTLTPKNDDELIILALLDSTAVGAGKKETWMGFSAILTGAEMGKEIKGAQNLNLSFNAGQLVRPFVYERSIA